MNTANYIDYEVSPDGSRVNVFPKEVLDMENTLDYFDRLKRDRRIKEGALEIVHFEHVSNFQVSHIECELIASTYQKQIATKTIRATIFVCETDLAYGIGRMLQTFHEMKSAGHKVLVAKSQNELEDLISTL